MSLSARSHFNPVLRFRKCPCVSARNGPGGVVSLSVCARARVCSRVYYIYTMYTLFFPSLPSCAEVGETPKEVQKGGVAPARRGRENKLISLTQPAVTPPQHDINPKPRLSLFKLYESLRRARGSRGTSWEVLCSIPLASSLALFRSHIPSLVGYKQEYMLKRKKGKL